MNRFTLYSPPRGSVAQQLNVRPFVSLALASHLAQAGELFPSPQLMTNSEIDFEIDALIQDLEEFLTRSKKTLLTSKARVV